MHAYDRRGYGGLPLAPGAPVLATHLGDLAAVLEATGSTRVFGHSGGAFYALQAALTLPVEAVAVYDPALAVDGLFPTAFVEPFGAAIEAGDFVTALLEMGLEMGRGIDAAGPGASHLPVPVQRFAIRMFLRTRIGAHLASLCRRRCPTSGRLRRPRGRRPTTPRSLRGHCSAVARQGRRTTDRSATGWRR